jgi:hypothetical protein
MSVAFSEQLVARYQKYMLDNQGMSISHEQAQLHLGSLSQLYTSFSFSKKRKGG